MIYKGENICKMFSFWILFCLKKNAKIFLIFLVKKLALSAKSCYYISVQRKLKASKGGQKMMAFYVIKYDNDKLAYFADAHDMLQECLCKPVKEINEFNLLPNAKYPRAVYHMPSSKRAWSELPDDWYEHSEDYLKGLMEGNPTYQFAEYMVRATYK